MSITTNGVTLTLIKFEKFETNIPVENKPTGPLVNISGAEGNNNTPYAVTVLAYLPDTTILSPINNTTGLQLQGNEIYLNYYGINPVSILNKQGGGDIVQGRDFRIDFNIEEVAANFDLYYVQFTYKVEEKGASADVIWVRDENESNGVGDERGSRGTITTPVTVPAPTL
ncbi:hypothetical protein [Tenacibaculum haliotis]|uniref:hypothetical protein n=1 Tax=Tenacibaculum haliotis TaxID=1888914 RepID=UPI0021AFC708|nr:hypothetical protein [Tenacibaculum haliotis]MCT4699360.1 hypothetical protein [Tenacibaculum haliotis]